MIEDFGTPLLMVEIAHTLNTRLDTASHCKGIDFAVAFHGLSASGLLCANGVCSESLSRNQ
jgi:hypothetical protein